MGGVFFFSSIGVIYPMVVILTSSKSCPVAIPRHFLFTVMFGRWKRASMKCSSS